MVQIDATCLQIGPLFLVNVNGFVNNSYRKQHSIRLLYLHLAQLYAPPRGCNTISSYIRHNATKYNNLVNYDFYDIRAIPHCLP